MSENESTNTAPKSFRTIAIVALIWNLLGAMAYILQVTMSPEAIAELPIEEQALYENIPTWATTAFAVAVWAGVAASVGLMIRKAWAYPAFILSLIGILLQDFHSFFMTNALEVYGVTGLVLPILVIAVAIYLVMYSKKAKDNGWIN